MMEYDDSNQKFTHSNQLSHPSSLAIKTVSIFKSDPNYYKQNWVLEMINVLPVWEQGIFGEGIRVRINDDGVDADHTEFAGRFDKYASCDSYHPQSPEDNHGTAVASIIGAAGDASECSVGIAPRVRLSACNAYGGSAGFLAAKVEAFDISQNSYCMDACIPAYWRRTLEEKSCPFTKFGAITGPCDVCDFTSTSKSGECEEAIIAHCFHHYEDDIDACVEFLDLYLWNGECSFNILSDEARDALTYGILSGRDGKGIIYVIAAGNGFATGDDTNFSGFANSRFTIAVGSVGADRRHASYSTPGASLFVSAPGGDFEESETNYLAAAVSGGCAEVGVGTSFSSPVVSGVVALVLQVNPELTWRDVQGILAFTSQRVDGDPNAHIQTENGAGIWHSTLYGFGIIDANAAVSAARLWDLYGPEKMLIGDSGTLNLPIYDDPSLSTISTVAVTSSGENDIVVENVEVYLDVQHFSRGHLEVVLTSPSGTTSILLPGKRPENTQLDDGEVWKLLTVRLWGESAEGTWTLEVTDQKNGDAMDCSDLPWAISHFNEYWDCTRMEAESYCEDKSSAFDMFLIQDGHSQDAQNACCICGGGEARDSGGGCADLRFAVTDDLGWSWGCEHFEWYGYCENGSMNKYFDIFTDQDETSRLIASGACCACGGGIDTTYFVDQLRRWRIVIYGHQQTSRTSSVRQQKPTSNSKKSKTEKSSKKKKSKKGKQTLV
jgi:subtilisin-like proprotein convertase family protein